MFPKEAVDERAATVLPPKDGSHELPQKGLHKLPHFLSLYDNFALCNLCGSLTSDSVYSCSICDSGDFSLCSKCLTKGRHCHDDNHYLREKRQGLPESYVSNVKETGGREIFAF